VTEIQARLQRLERILAVSQDLTSTVTLEPLLKKIVTTAADLTHSEGASILLLDPQTDELRFHAAASDPSGQLFDIAVPSEGSIAGAVVSSGQAMIVSDTQSDPRHYGVVGQQVGFETHSLLAVPLQIKDRCIGVLEAVNRQGEQEFSQEDVGTLTALATSAAVAIENARLVEALQEANERLGELDRLKSDFIAIASHELRTPLSLILGYAAMLRERVEDTAGMQLDAVLRAALRLKHIIETMLNLRYLETGELLLTREWFDLCGLVRQACKDYRSLLQGKRLTLQVETPESGVLVHADRAKLRVVMDNLLSNAVKFTPPGGQVRVTIAQEGDQVEVGVADTGIGIPQEALEQVFESFQQAEDPMTRRYGGMGLGLSIVKGLVELHGGRVWVESLVDRGSCFAFVLPTGQGVENRSVRSGVE